MNDKISLTFFFTDYDDFFIFYLLIENLYDRIFKNETKFIIIRQKQNLNGL